MISALRPNSSCFSLPEVCLIERLSSLQTTTSSSSTLVFLPPMI